MSEKLIAHNVYENQFISLRNIVHSPKIHHSDIAILMDYNRYEIDDKFSDVKCNVYIPAEFLNDDCVVAHLYDDKNNFLRFSFQHGMDIADAIKYYSSNNHFVDDNVIEVRYIVLTKRNVVLKTPLFLSPIRDVYVIDKKSSEDQYTIINVDINILRDKIKWTYIENGTYKHKYVDIGTMFYENCKEATEVLNSINEANNKRKSIIDIANKTFEEYVEKLLIR